MQISYLLERDTIQLIQTKVVLLHCALAAAVYCNRSCLWVCVCVCVGGFACMWDC